jgi:hypothetical protein
MITLAFLKIRGGSHSFSRIIFNIIVGGYLGLLLGNKS